MANYSKMSWKEIHEALDNNPPETPHYIKAKAERDARLWRYGFFIAVGGLVIAGIKLFIK